MTKPVIHVGFDDSWRDTGALEWALQESLLRQEPLQAVHVIDDRIRTVAGVPPDLVDDQATELVNTVQGYLDGRPGGSDHEAELMVGPPARTLTEAAAESRMLVVGRRGMGTFKRLLIGSTSEAVVSRTTVPVVIVPDRWTPSGHAGPVVVALDQGDDNAAVLEFAITAVRERKVPVRIVYVFDLPGLYGWQAVNLDDGMREKAERHFGDVVGEWQQKYPDVAFEVDVRRGHRVDGVLNGAANADAQLLVVGAHHHARVAAAFLGTVTRGVLHHATCPLAVVPV
ncbi:universal stress protein [Kribbella sp. NPDC059898]|uniref:universal stress protein n=1 Tax=Kribbella sp. NPDC059898 TaxID=3346995 RepID=UPI0036635338